jgi:predicted  nucleic acid-binding Zn-ribbon protein
MKKQLELEIEIKLLKDTISALREELERTQIEKKEEIQRAVADANSEIRQLRANITQMRDQIESREAEHEQKVLGLRTENQREVENLHGAIAALREQLEGLNESSKKARNSRETSSAARTSR